MSKFTSNPEEQKWYLKGMLMGGACLLSMWVLYFLFWLFPLLLDGIGQLLVPLMTTVNFISIYFGQKLAIKNYNKKQKNP